LSRAAIALGVSLLAVVAATAVLLLLATGGSADPLWLLPLLLALAAIPVAFVLGARTRAATTPPLADVVVALQGGVPIREAIAEALGDPTLEIAFRLPGSVQWVDQDGRRVQEPRADETRAVTLVEWVGLPIAALVHDARLEEARELVDAVAAAASLSLQNERLQTQVRAQVQMMTALTDTAPSLLVSIDTEGRIQSQNRAAVAAAGVDDQELVRGRFFWDVFISPEERADVIERFHALAPDYDADEYENVFTNERGEERVIAWRAAPVVGPDGTVESIVAGGMDITDRKRREVELQRERDATTTVIQTIPSFIVVLDVEGSIVDRVENHHLAAVNRAFRETLGWSDEQLIGRELVGLLDEPDRGVARRAVMTAAGGGLSGELESRWRCADGSLIVVAWRAAPVADATGRRSRLVLVTGSDVTERKRHEEEVRASRSRLVAAADDARRRLERNLHDGAQQRLVALSVSLRLAEARLADDPVLAASILSSARGELAQALEELRELARGIHPAVLTDRGLSAAVDALVARSPVPVTADVSASGLEPAVEAAVYYVVSESLANVAKYAHARAVEVRVDATEGGVTVTVSDDGVGGADPLAGSGLRGLADRLAALDGTLSIESPRGEGTRVLAVIPVRRHAPAT
jgi:PAS domain S-box-containing protein